MKQINLDKMEITYTPQGDYLLPDIKLPQQDNRPIGIWGQRRKKHLKEHHKIRYYNYLTKGTLNSHLADVNEESEELFSQVVKDLAEKENITEQLKAENPMLWVQKMNNIQNQAREVVYAEVIFV